TVRVKLFKGHAIVEGRKSPNSLYSEELATYSKHDTFNHMSAVGFIELFGMPTVVAAEVAKNAK
ncbi:MAG: argininosuccinate synthase, partial [Lysinibacillus sp.]